MADNQATPAADAAAKPARRMPSSKNEAVLWAVRALGRDAKPPEVQAFVKREYGLDMTIAHIYTAKSVAVKALKRKGGRPKGTKSAAPATATPRPHVAAAGGGITLEDIAAVKALADKIGAEKVRQLAAVLAR